MALALVLALGPLWATCTACSPAKQDPVGEHDCCKKGSHHKDGPQDSKSCPHSQFAPQAYEKVDQVERVAPVSTMAAESPAVVGMPAVPDAADANGILPDTHAPPGLFVLNSSFRI